MNASPYTAEDIALIQRVVIEHRAELGRLPEGSAAILIHDVGAMIQTKLTPREARAQITMALRDMAVEFDVPQAVSVAEMVERVDPTPGMSWYVVVVAKRGGIGRIYALPGAIQSACDKTIPWGPTPVGRA